MSKLLFPVVGELRCAKCQGSEILCRWHIGGRYSDLGCGHFSKLVEQAEYLHYTCQTCFYEWVGVTADNWDDSQELPDKFVTDSHIASRWATRVISSKSRIAFVVSAAILVGGVLVGKAWLCVLAWMLLWAAAVTQDRGLRR